MKNFRKFVLALLIIFFALGIISGDAMADNESLNIAILGRAQTLDPAHLQRSVSEWPIMNSIFNGLVRYEPGSFEIEPDLAREWEISEDRREITFYLREGIEFHNDYGELTAEDVKFSFERIIDPDVPTPEAESFAKLERVDVVDEYTAKIILEEPMGRLFASTLPYNAGLIVSKEAVEEMGREEFAYNPVGTGPYEFAEWDVDENIHLERNNNYWNQEEKPVYSQVQFSPIEDPTAQELALQSGDIDIGEVTPDNLDMFKDDADFTVETFPDLAHEYVAFNTSRYPLENKKLREALRYIIDPEELIAGAYAGIPERAYSPLNEDMIGYWEAPSYDLQDVGEDYVWELLAEAGYPEGEGLELEYVDITEGARRLIATILQDQLAAFNIKLDVEIMEVGPRIDRWQEGSFDVTYSRFGDTTDPGYNLQWYISDQIGNWNIFHWSNEEFDELWSEAETTIDVEARAEKYREMQQLMHEDSIGVWVTHGVKTPAWRADLQPAFLPDGTILSWLIE